MTYFFSFLDGFTISSGRILPDVPVLEGPQGGELRNLIGVPTSLYGLSLDPDANDIVLVADESGTIVQLSYDRAVPLVTGLGFTALRAGEIAGFFATEADMDTFARLRAEDGFAERFARLKGFEIPVGDAGGGELQLFYDGAPLGEGERLYGTDGADVLNGTAGNDRIDLHAGRDLYRGLAGDDHVEGGSGDDTLIGGPGSDTLLGSRGGDLLIADTVADVSSTVGALVYRIYRATLGRDPDTAGFVNWTQRLEDGTATRQEIVSGFVNSAEFDRVYGPSAAIDGAFVTLLYSNVLDRGPDQDGLEGWLAQLAGGLSREDVVLGFAQSAEFIANSNAEAYTYLKMDAADGLDDVFRLYQTTLDRAPDLTGLQNWTHRLDEGLELRSVVSGFVNSTEFQNIYGSLDNAGFVMQLYENVLGRVPDAAGLENWVSRLDSGISREEIVLGFSQSAEFQDKTAAELRTYMSAVEGDRIDGGEGSDLLFGGLGGDEFVFEFGDAGADRVVNLDDWDTLSFTGFSYDTVSDAVSHMAQVGRDVVFSDGTISVTLMNVELEIMDRVTILLE